MSALGHKGQAQCIVLKSSLHSAHIDTTEPTHDHPTRRLQLRAASPYD